MALRDEVKEQKGKLKGKSFKEKMNYFWYYYKVHTIVAFFVIVVGGVFIKDAVTARDSAFSATLLNAYASSTQTDLETEFAAYADIDTTVYDCYIDTGSTLSYETMSELDLAVSQRISAMTQTNSLDVVVSDLEPFSNFSLGMMFCDLREELTPEEFEKYKEDFFYIDAAAIEDENEDIAYDQDGLPLVVNTGIDHSNPETMEEPVPVGIYLDDCAKLKKWECYTATGETPIFGFVYSSAKKDVAHIFLKYLTE